MRASGRGVVFFRTALGTVLLIVVAAPAWKAPEPLRPWDETRVVDAENGDAGAVEVGMTDANMFVPAAVRVKVGTTVVWRNRSQVVHTVTASGFDSGSVQPNGTYRHTFTAAGTYSYHCVPHRQMSMVGTVVVEG